MNEAADELTREVAGLDRGTSATLRPRDAATLIIIDRTGPRPRVLMGRRHPGHVFMPGKFVVPGGRIEAGDRHMSVAGVLAARTEAALAARVTRPPRHVGRALALAAIRETFEETGLLLGTREHGPPETAPDGSWQRFREEGVMPDLSAIQFVARATTPPGRPRRFDTRFFAVDRETVAGEVAGIVGPESELSELAWVEIETAKAMEIPPITRTVLRELETRIAAGFGPELPVPDYRMVRGAFVRAEL